MNGYTTPQVVWVKGQAMPNVWLTTGTENPAILLAWSYKTWTKAIIKGQLPS